MILVAPYARVTGGMTRQRESCLIPPITKACLTFITGAEKRDQRERTEMGETREERTMRIVQIVLLHSQDVDVHFCHILSLSPCEPLTIAIKLCTPKKNRQ